jgi:hypothetical protein
MDAKGVLDSFVARVWLEGGPGESVVLRGHIRRIKGTEEAYFQGLEEMAEFITGTSGVQIRKEKQRKTDDDS